MFGCKQFITMVMRNSLHFFVVFWFADLKRLLHALNYSVPLWKISVLSQGMEKKVEHAFCWHWDEWHTLWVTRHQHCHWNWGWSCSTLPLCWTNSPEPLLWIKLRSCSGLELFSIIFSVSFNPSQLFPLALCMEQETGRQRGSWFGEGGSRMLPLSITASSCCLSMLMPSSLHACLKQATVLTSPLWMLNHHIMLKFAVCTGPIRMSSQILPCMEVWYV